MIMSMQHPKHYLMLWHVSRNFVFEKYLLFFLFAFLNLDHRENGNRVIHEKLTGSALYPGALFDPYEQQ
jgi:hypothetical protein